MQRIPLEVYEFANGLRVMAHFWLKIEDLSRSIPIRAIVDTGSPVTLIGSLDTMKMRISKLSLRNLIGRNKPINIGGGLITTRILENTTLKFGNGFEVNLPVDFPIEGVENSSQPSLLGVDFLLKTKALLVFNPSKREAYFEIE